MTHVFSLFTKKVFFSFAGVKMFWYFFVSTLSFLFSIHITHYA
eukprot:UN12142